MVNYYLFDFGRCAAPCVDHDDDEIDGFSFGYATCAVDMFAVCVFPFDSFSLTFVIAAAAGGSLDRRHPFLGWQQLLPEHSRVCFISRLRSCLCTHHPSVRWRRRRCTNFLCCPFLAYDVSPRSRAPIFVFAPVLCVVWRCCCSLQHDPFSFVFFFYCSLLVLCWL